jgi:hypothetical protein
MKTSIKRALIRRLAQRRGLRLQPDLTRDPYATGSGLLGIEMDHEPALGIAARTLSLEPWNPKLTSLCSMIRHAMGRQGDEYHPNPAE